MFTSLYQHVIQAIIYCLKLDIPYYHSLPVGINGQNQIVDIPVGSIMFFSHFINFFLVLMLKFFYIPP